MSADTYIAERARSAPPPFASESFKALQRVWYGKLAATGFVDAEVKSLSGWDGRLPREYDRGMPREQYYRLAGWWLHDKVWPSRAQRRAFELHAEGVTFRAMPELLAPMPRTGDPRALCRLVKREAMRMAKHYTGLGDGR